MPSSPSPLSPPQKPQTWFSWTGRDAQGQDQSGQMPALDRADVEAHLHAQRIRPIRIQRKRQPQAPRPARAKEVARFTRQLATLVQAGIPLLSALKLLDNATEHPSMRAVAQDLMTQVQSGASLHQAMQTHDCFGPVYLGMVAAAEASGAAGAGGYLAAATGLGAGGTPTAAEGCQYKNASETSTTRAQQTFVVQVELADGSAAYIWTGDRWQQSPDGTKGHDPETWLPLAFDDAAGGAILPVVWQDSFTLDVAD